MAENQMMREMYQKQQMELGQQTGYTGLRKKQIKPRTDDDYMQIQQQMKREIEGEPS